MSAVTQYKRVRIHAYVDGELARRLAAYGAATGLNVSTVVRAALAQYLDKTGDTTLLLRCLDRLGRALGRAHRDLEFLLEAFAVFVKLWLAYAPRIEPDAKDAARRSAEIRFKQFTEHVVRQFTGGHRFLDDLPREVLADESELAGVVGEPSESPSSVDPQDGDDDE